MKRREPSFLFNYLLWTSAVVPIVWVLGYTLAIRAITILPSDIPFSFIILAYLPALFANLIQGLAFRRFGTNLRHWTLVTILGYAIAIFAGLPGLSLIPALAQSLVLRRHAAWWLVWGVVLTIAVEIQFLAVLLFTFLFGEVNPFVYIPASAFFTVVTGIGAYFSKIKGKSA